jgi:FtsZ-interacting cell division protein YlmF
VSLFSRLRAVVSGDDYLDGEYDDELEYDTGEIGETAGVNQASATRTSTAPLALGSDFTADDPFAGTNVIGLPGLSSAVAEVYLMEPRSFDEMPRAIQALRERKTVILNLTMMEPDQAQRAVDWPSGARGREHLPVRSQLCHGHHRRRRGGGFAHGGFHQPQRRPGERSAGGGPESGLGPHGCPCLRRPGRSASVWWAWAGWPGPCCFRFSMKG